jgi:outer membrane lipoprotein carrier protein
MKSIITLSIILMSTALTYAQQAEKDLNPQDPKAQSILDALSDKASAYKSFTADFEYTLINKTEGINETQKGKVTMKGKKKYKLEVAGQEIVCNGETVWTFIKDAGELQISDVPEESEEDGNIMNPANAFHMYKKGFKYQYDGKSTIDGKSVDVIRMFPMNPSGKNFHTIIVNIDADKLELVNMVVKGKDGNEYTYRLKNFKADIPVTDADFEFNEDRADDIIDLRD